MNVEHALILSGGAGRRMGRAKEFLHYNGSPQHERVYALMSACFSRVFFSVAADASSSLSEYPCIVDFHHARCGPMLGILSAFRAHHVPWFVVAIDMPSITKELVLRVLSERATMLKTVAIHAFVAQSRTRNFFDPLFAVYEPSIANAMEIAFTEKKYSLQELLHQSTLSIHPFLVDNSLLQNINTPEEYNDYLSAVAPQTSCDKK